MLYTILTIALGTILGAVMNRLRGTKSVYAWAAAGVLGACVFMLGGGWLAAILTGAAYVLGENWGWTKWTNCIPGQFTQSAYNRRWAYPLEVDAPHYEKIMQYVITDKEDYKPYVFVGMVIRGLLWWAPVLAVLWWFGLVGLVVAIATTVGLSVAFPVVYKFAHSVQVVNGRYLQTAEVFYGALYGAILAIVLTI